ncbi:MULTISPECIES: arsenite efflux transporter metallochaperone ArsD [unclassified Thiocapsa]|uniref:arsenite efflux transporter metallochaperone ArsD n=1 Tax=unclassified Thiocapsa TaxID=2641286 RepID=UPI0035AEAABF
MTHIQVFDPALCCSTGVCGVDVDQALVSFSADVEWAKQNSARIERFNLAQEPLAFAENAVVRGFLERSGQEALPLSELTRDYDHIVFDTAPTGHTIRLLHTPGAWSGFLEAGKGDASCLGPLAGLDKQRAQYSAAVDALADPERTRLVLVARAQQATLREVARTHEELAAIGLKQQYLVVNGVLADTAAVNADGAGTGADALAAAIGRREQEALATLPDVLKTLPMDRIALKPFNLVGLDALHGLLTDTVPIDAPEEIEAPPLEAPDLSTRASRPRGPDRPCCADAPRTSAGRSMRWPSGIRGAMRSWRFKRPSRSVLSDCDV